MSSRIQVYPVFGCNAFEPRCFVLKIDKFKLLLDCGWNSRFDVADIEGLKSVDLSSIDAVLLSQPDLLHIGALPYAYAKLGLNAPIFATSPIWRMGQYMLMDAFISMHNRRADFDLFTHEDIKNVFKTKFKSKLKYSQEYPLTKEIKSEGNNDENKENPQENNENKTSKNSAKTQHNKLIKRIGNSNTMQSLSDLLCDDDGSHSASLLITPFAAGHMVGGTIWKISADSENIIYAIDYNIRREKHLNESVFGILEIRPTLLITDCINIGEKFIVRRKQRENELYNLCITPLRNGGNVLIPSDSSGRCLEILYSLYQSFSKHKLWDKYHLIFISYTSKNTLTSAKSMLEWMCDSCQKELNKSQKNVFEFKELLVCQSMNELKASVKYPYVAIATNEFLQCGMSQDLFINLSHHTSNQVLLTQRTDARTLSGKLLNIIRNGNTAADRNIEFECFHKEKLNQEERMKYLEEKKRIEMEEKEKEKQERESAIAFNNNETDDDGDVCMDETEDKDDEDKEKGKDKDDEDDHGDAHVMYDVLLNKRIKMTSAYSMYPWNEHEQEMIMTDYGLKVDLNEWRSEQATKKRKRAINDENEFEIMSKTNSLSPSPNDIMNQTMSLLPRNIAYPNVDEPEKTVKIIKKLFVKCQLKYLNVEGRSDYESIKQTLPTLQPRQIILVHGSMKQKEEFKQFIVEENICKHVMIAQNLKWHHVNTNTKYKKIVMDDIIERSLDFININGYDVAYLKGKLQEIDRNKMNIDVGDIKKHRNIINDIQYKLTKSNEKGDEMDIDMTSNENINKIKINYPCNDGHCLTYLGDVTKIEMETNLKQNKIAAELYYGGTLVAGKSGEVRITHKDAQKTTLAVDATLTGDYFKIRDTIANQYHLI